MWRQRWEKLLKVKEERRIFGFLWLIIHSFSHHQAKTPPSVILFVIKYIRNGWI